MVAAVVPSNTSPVRKVSAAARPAIRGSTVSQNAGGSLHPLAAGLRQVRARAERPPGGPDQHHLHVRIVLGPVESLEDLAYQLAGKCVPIVLRVQGQSRDSVGDTVVNQAVAEVVGIIEGFRHVGPSCWQGADQ